MTIDEAIAAARKAILADWALHQPHWLWPPDGDQKLREQLLILQGIGLLEFTRQETEAEIRSNALQAAWRAAGGQTDATTGPPKIEAALERYGFEIVRKA